MIQFPQWLQDYTEAGNLIILGLGLVFFWIFGRHMLPALRADYLIRALGYLGVTCLLQALNSEAIYLSLRGLWFIDSLLTLQISAFIGITLRVLQMGVLFWAGYQLLYRRGKIKPEGERNAYGNDHAARQNYPD
jgi:hypothetical protein